MVSRSRSVPQRIDRSAAHNGGMMETHCLPTTRTGLDHLKLERLNTLLAEILPANRFYAEKCQGLSFPLTSLEELSSWPLTTKDELVTAADAAGHPGNLTYPLARYQRFHQTSGTRGNPMPVFDTAEDWAWWMECWRAVLKRGEVGPGDRVLVASSFGPYAGFWSGFDGVLAAGAMAIPCGGMTSRGRLDLAQRTSATVVMATPSYGLHLAETAREANIDLAAFPIRCVIVAGEPGGSVPSVRARLAEAFGAEVLDHAGATEVGPWGVGDVDGRFLEVLEPWFHAEFLPQEATTSGGEPLSELVLTTLGRSGAPVLRYRTGDLVQPQWPGDTPQAPPRVRLMGGVLGRRDDMLVIRGVNIFPRAIDEILRGFPEIAEYRVGIHRRGALDDLSVEVEDANQAASRVADALKLRLGLRIEVRSVAPGSLPRFEGKGRRFVDHRSSQPVSSPCPSSHRAAT
jgi:phenylacetate-CoA ligase